MKPNQNGAALIVGLVILIVLSLLGITGMKSSILEEKMAGNLRNQTLAFQTSESCLTRAMNTPDGFTINISETRVFDNDNYQVIGFGSNQSNYHATSKLRTNGSPPRGSGYSAIRFNVAHDVIRCTSTTQTNARTTLQQGFFQVGPKAK